jgi:hypothetical protein
LGFKFDRALVGKTRVQSRAIIEGFDVVEEGGASFGQGAEAMMVNQFVFEAAPKRLDEGIVVAVALASHRSEQSVLSQNMAVSGAVELGATIGVNDEGLKKS